MVLPHSQRHNHLVCPFSLVANDCTVSLPNVLPVRSTLTPRTRHPQLLVKPARKLPALTSVVLPQSQIHSHTAFLLLSKRTIDCAVRRPNRCPVKSNRLPFAM